MATMTYPKFIAARRPKIEGTKNLHDYFISRSISLDFFIMLSSVAGLVGSPSQSNYAAGNTFQDAFAYYRQAQGLPALAMDVGFVVDVGWTASHLDILRTGRDKLEIEITSKDLEALIEYHVTRWIDHRDKGNTASIAAPASQVAIGLGGMLPEDARFSHIKASRVQVSTTDTYEARVGEVEISGRW